MQQRRTIAISNTLQIAVRRARAPLLTRQIKIDVAVILGVVVVDDRIALVVIAAANQPTEDMQRSCRGSAMREAASRP